jgi:hypothetical protein
LNNFTAEVYGTEEARAEIATMIATGHADTWQLTYARWRAVIAMVGAGTVSLLSLGLVVWV